MIVATSPAALAASLVALATSGVFLATMVRYRDDPTTRPLIGVAVTLLVGAVVHVGVVDLAPIRELLGIQWQPTALVGGPWLLLAFDLQAVVSGFWFLFALQYTGRDRRTSPIALSAVGVLLVCLVAPTVALTVLGSVVATPTGTFNALLGSTIVLAESLALIGVFFVLATTLRHKAFPAGQTAVLTAAVGAVLTLPFAATTLQAPMTTPVAVTVSSLLFTAAVRRYRLFERLPVASVIGRDRVSNEMADGVVMVGRDGRIRDLNLEAERLLAVSHADAVGAPLETVAPAVPQPAVAATEPTDVRLDSGRIAAISAETVTDDHGRELGALLVCRDVTEARQRERRLGVLTQLLVGALQAEMTDVAHRADAVANGEESPEHSGQDIHETATDVATLVARVREIEQALAAHPNTSTSADLEAVLSELREATAVDVVTTPAQVSPVVGGDTDLLTATLHTLTTAAGTPDEPATLRVEDRNDAVTVTLSPFAPGPDGTVADVSLRIARLATEQTEWSVRQPTDAGDPSVIVRLPTATRRSGGPQPPEEQA
ncbi:histidine kinase N-terminal 7TM domain-containing protein [Halorientalis brevis]|uniref:Histidine kinase N-terminal 7TM domain-containing protein n=1 Tax=Halorientalis brevis TaxID=1126241 RepID=A0ABD6CEE7_9EURY|nr:histidine kinase N-terminal 7TM domain-containing protein [Halorientalis brevis]